MSHPSLGLPPPDPTAGFPAAAERIRLHLDRLAARAVGIAADADETMRDRYDEAGMRHLVRDAALLAERVALCVATADPTLATEYAEMTAPVYRRRRTPMDDLVAICAGLKQALPTVLAPGELGLAVEAIDGASDAWHWHRRIAGDARKKNPILQFLYKGG